MNFKQSEYGREVMFEDGFKENMHNLDVTIPFTQMCIYSVIINYLCHEFPVKTDVTQAKDQAIPSVAAKLVQHVIDDALSEVQLEEGIKDTQGVV